MKCLFEKNNVVEWGGEVGNSKLTQDLLNIYNKVNYTTSWVPGPNLNDLRNSSFQTSHNQKFLGPWLLTPKYPYCVR